jgi:hypothetical protein
LARVPNKLTRTTSNQAMGSRNMSMSSYHSSSGSMQAGGTRLIVSGLA